MTKLGELELEEAARNAAGNWRRFNSFVWFRQRDLDDADDWSMIYDGSAPFFYPLRRRKPLPS